MNISHLTSHLQLLQAKLTLQAYDMVSAQPLPPADCSGVNLVKPVFTKLTAVLLGFVGPWLVFVVIIALLSAAAVVLFRRRLSEVLTIAGIALLIGIMLPALLAFAPTLISSQC